MKTTEPVAWAATKLPEWWQGAPLIWDAEHKRLLTLGGVIPHVARNHFKPLYLHPDNGTNNE